MTHRPLDELAQEVERPILSGMVPPTLRTPRLRLRPARPEDAPSLSQILAEPTVAAHWRAYDEARVLRELCAPDDEKIVLCIEHEEALAGAIQFYEQADADYRHAGVDLFLSAPFQGRGLGQEAIRAVVEHVFLCGHHRVVIDPALHNARAIRCYAGIGFRPVGVLRRYERGPDGVWHDGLLMELLSTEYRPAGPKARTPTPAPVLRRATAADLQQILPMMEDFNRIEGIAWNRRDGEAPLRKLLDGPEIGLVGLVQAQDAAAPPQGYFVLTWGFDLEWGGRDAILTELYLCPAARGLGLGPSLMAAVEAEARLGGAGALHLMVRTENTPALRLYLATGYRSPDRIFLSHRLTGPLADN